ncbi:MAG: carboxypeptidase regulatory-like domain-containing protein [Armatimonadota bacterium]
MKRSIFVLLSLAILVIAASCAHGYVVFQDDFTGLSGNDPKWDVLSGTFGAWGGTFVPGGGTGNWTENLAAPKDLLVDKYTMTATVLTDSSWQDLWWVQVHRKDANNFLRLYVDMSAAQPSMYWQAVVNGAWLFDPPRYSVALGSLITSNMNLTVQMDATGATVTLSDGTNSCSTTLPDAEIPSELKGDSRVAIAKYTWGASWVGFDNVVIDNGETPPPGDVNGTVRDSKTGLAIGQAYVEVVGTGLSTSTLTDGTYSFTGVPAGENKLSVRHDGYITSTNTSVTVPMGGSVVKDVDLDPVGLDQARSSVVTVSGNSADAPNLNDGDSSTGWNVDPELGPEWIQLAWDNPWNVACVVVDHSGSSPGTGATPDYIIESSTDGSSWTNIAYIEATEYGHPHKLRVVNLSSPRAMKYLRLRINSAPGDTFGKFWSVEAYKATGTVAGYVRDANGVVQNAMVFVTEASKDTNNPGSYVRGPGRLPISGTTNTNGYYSIPVPQGTAMVTACAFDSLTVSSNPVDILTGSTTAVPDVVLNTRASSGPTFSDTFSIPDGADPLWSPVMGDPWLVTDNPYVVGERVYATPGTADATSLVNTPAFRDGVFEVDRITVSGTAFGIVTRFQTWPVFNMLHCSRSRLEWYENAALLAGGRYVPIDADWDLHMRAVVAGNMCQGFIYDGSNTYWTDPTQLTGLASGKAGLYGPTSDGKYDNFTVKSGTAPPPSLLGIAEAKASGAGWFGYIKGYVTALFNDYNTFVIEDESRASAITVVPLVNTLHVGQEVLVLGYIQDDGTFRLIEYAATGSEKILQPIGIKNRDMAGADSSTGCSNTDLLAHAWGKVLGEPITNPGDGNTTFYMTDGSAGGRSTAQVLGQWTLEFQDDFNSGRNAAWYDYATMTMALGGALQCDGNNITWVTGAYLEDGIVAADIVDGTTGQIGLLARLAGASDFLMANWLQSQNRIYFHERKAGDLGSPLGSVFDVQLSLPAHMTLEVHGSNAKFTVSDAIRSYSSSITLTRPSHSGLVGIYHDFTLNAIDNFKAYSASAPVDIDADVVQVTIPHSVTDAIAVHDGDYVKAIGIVGKGSTLTGALRGITIRKAEDLSKE